MEKLLDPYVISLIFYENAYDLAISNDDKYLFMIDLSRGVYTTNIEKLYKKNG